MKYSFIKIILILTLLFSFSCSVQNDSFKGVVIAVDSDVESFNPLFAFNVVEGNLADLLYMSLVINEWDNVKGEMVVKPLLADSLIFAKDSSKIKVALKKNVYWSDGQPVTTDDIIYSFYAYSSKEIESRLYGAFENFKTNDKLEIIPEESFKKINDSELIISFSKNAKPTYQDIDFPILPSHIYKNIPPAEISTNQINFSPVTCGPYKLKEWIRNQNISLEKDPSNFLISEVSPAEIIFKIVPDYSSRINQLITGEVDIASDIKAEDAKEISKYENIKIGTVKGRQYDYIGWNNISPTEFDNGKLIPHPLFGKAKVRKALTMAINREEILNSFLNSYGELADGPISEFTSGVKLNNEHLKFDPESAASLLAEEGWKDTDADGVLDKNGVDFSFKLYISPGNPLRENAATVVKNNLAAIKIKIEIVPEELGIFIDNLYEKNYDAWLIGWFVPLPLDLKSYWYSDLNNTPNNFVSYTNRETDKLIDAFEITSNDIDKQSILQKIQNQFIEDQPVTFLYWVDGITAYNPRIKNISINPLGDIQHCWNWKITD